MTEDVEDRDPWYFQRWARVQTTGSPARKSMLNTLAGMADATSGRCEAKLRSLAEHCEMKERAARGHMTALVEMKLVARRPQYRRDGGRRGDEYLLLAPGITEWPDGELVEEAPRQNLPGAPAAEDRGSSPADDEAPRQRSAAQEHPPSSPSSGTHLEPPPADAESDVVDRLVQFWIDEMPDRRGKARITDGRRRVVRARLRTFSPKQLAVVIREVTRQPFYMGQNGRDKVYNDLPLIFKNDEKVEGFLGDAERRAEGATPGGTPGPSPYSQAATKRAADVDGTIDALDQLIEMAERNGGDL